MNTAPHELDPVAPDFPALLTTDAAVLQRSCCCCAPPQIQVILPVPGHPGRRTDLLLCGHHYRQCAERLCAGDLGAELRVLVRPTDEPAPATGDSKL